MTPKSNDGASLQQPGCAALVRRIGWHDWQEAATLIKTTKNGWRIRWDTGLHRGKTVNLTKRNWVVKPHND